MTTTTDPYEKLCREYDDWNFQQGLKLGSADEHTLDPELTDAQRYWLRDFCDRWEIVATQERLNWLKAIGKRLGMEDEAEACAHEWIENADEQHHGEGRMYCMWCGADGDG